MKPITKPLKNILQGLWYDAELVTEIKKANLNKEQLYNYLSIGKITLAEYVNAVK